MTNLRRWDGRLRNYLREFLLRFDVVNIHFLADWGFGEWIVEERASRAVIVATAWGSDIVDPPGEAPATPELIRARVQLLRAADAVTVCGPTFARTVARFADMPIESLEIVPFGVDLDLFTRGCPAACGGVWTDGSARATGGACRIGFFKGFRAVYGPRCLIRAIPQVVAQVPNARFDLIGDGAELAACHALACDLGVDSSIEWIPRQDHARLPEYLSRWNVSVIPSVHEAFGVAALESSAMQVPVVASDVCGLRDTVRHGETGLLVPPDDPPRLGEAIVRQLRDADLHERMGEAGRRLVEREYNWQALADQWVGLYERVCEQACSMPA
jgi:glycosyltransferase involved in cell wall biosynthesis